MTTTVTKTIGTGGDYTTLQAWEDACPANLVTSDQIWQGQCFNQEFFSSSATLLTVSGTTTDATRYKELTTYAGASFVDNANAQTNALRYNASNGAGIRGTYAWSAPVAVNESYFRISKLQILAGTATAFNGSGTTGMVMDKCIIENSGVSNEALKTYGSCTVKNTLVVGRSTGVIAALSNGTSAYNCTFARTGTSTANIFTGSYSTTTLKNCAFFGGATTLASGSSTRTYTTCYTDTASPPSGCTTVAYDTSTGSGFENKTDATRDFRIKAGSALLDVGTTDTTNAANDIVGTSRPQGSAYDVGAWELVVASGHTLTGGNASQASTSGTGVVTQTQVLVSANSSEASTSGTGAVTQNQILVAANSSEASTSGTGVVTQNQILVVTNTTQDSTSGTGVVSVSSGLVAATSTQDSTSGTGVITQNHILVSAGSSEASSSGTGIITQIQVLVAANVTQDSVSGTGAVTVSGPSLIAATSTQDSTSGVGSVTQNHILVGASGVQVSNSSNVVISKGQLLVVANCSQSNTSPGSSIAIFGNSPSVFSVEVPARIYGSSVKPRSYATEKREGKYNGTYRGL